MVDLMSNTKQESQWYKQAQVWHTAFHIVGKELH